MTWQLGAALNATIGVCYLAIAWVIARGLWRTGQLRSNRLAVATGAIFFTCGVHHGGHALHVLLPAFGIDEVHGVAMRRAFTWQMDAWDVVGAAVAIFYLSLRRSYGRLLHQPDMFENADRERYERALEHERAMLAEAQQIAHIGSWAWEIESDTLTWSAQLYRIFGRDPTQGPLPLADVAELIHPDDRGVVSAQGAAIRRGEDFQYECRIPVADPEGGAQTRHLHVIGHPDGPERYVGTVQDITAARRTEQALRVAQERLRVTVVHAPIGVALVDLRSRSGRLLSVNDALCKLVGYREADLLEMGLSSIVHPEDGGALARDLQLLASDDQARIELEVRCLPPSGTPVLTLLTGATVPGAAGGPEFAVFHVLDITERKAFEGQLRHLADHDGLTGLFNRRRFEQELERTVAESRRYGRSGALLLIDLDGFKFVNDTLGHSCGDELLSRVGAGLRAALRDTDVLGRLGGDEFAVILPQADVAEARSVADKLIDTLAERAFVSGDRRRARVTASIGLTTFGPTDLATAEDLIVEADIAMYSAKERGKNCVAVYERGRDVRGGLVNRQGWLGRLRAAIDHDGFELMAQPQLGICAGGAERYELLLRLRGDDGELVPPGTFLHIAERFDLIQEIDRWVLAQAVELLALHEARGHDISLSVNMSGPTLEDPGILDYLAGLLAERPIAAGRLIVEVTESVAIGNIDRARSLARGLRELGCRFALDDFGAAFASFPYLKYLEFDFLKIDGEFIKALSHNTIDKLVVRSLVDIAQSLGAQTVAECVGNSGALEQLESLGVDYGQGYFLGVPMPVARTLPALQAP